jgi:hypothetical protein
MEKKSKRVSDVISTRARFVVLHHVIRTEILLRQESASRVISKVLVERREQRLEEEKNCLE